MGGARRGGQAAPSEGAGSGSGFSTRWTPSFDGHVGVAFAELADVFKEGFPLVNITRSDFLWLIAKHFEEHPPDAQWVREQLRRGRSAKIDYRRRRTDAQFEKEMRAHEESLGKHPGITGPERPVLVQSNAPPSTRQAKN